DTLRRLLELSVQACNLLLSGGGARSDAIALDLEIRETGHQRLLLRANIGDAVLHFELTQLILGGIELGLQQLCLLVEEFFRFGIGGETCMIFEILANQAGKEIMRPSRIV